MVAKNANRLGVGATLSTTTTTTAQHDALAAADWTKTGRKKILSIGKKQHPHADDDDDASKREDDNFSSDEDEGRTSAVKERKRKITNASLEVTSSGLTDSAVGAVASKRKKKKKGKKERDHESNAAIVGKASGHKENLVADDRNIVQAKDQIEPGNISVNQQNKKKTRKKIRSRQKNIRKDTRSIDEKPAHLVVGNSDYTGRQLTKATKEKLGLTTQAKHCFPDRPTASKTEVSSSDESANRMKESNLKQSTVENDATSELTKIGDCVVGDVVVRSKEDTDPGGIKKKKPRRKFKNC